MERGATISPCGLYRYELTRQWGDGPILEFIMLNPSTADGSEDDPTIRRCVGFAVAWGYGSIVVRNLYAFRATDPSALRQADDPIGPENLRYLSATDADFTVAAWGANPAATIWWGGTATKTLTGRKLFCLGTTKSGSPRHPLYVPSRQTPVAWNPQSVS